MPKPLNADWNFGQVLYSQGISYKAIAEKLGVSETALRQRAHRGHWRAQKTASLAVVSQSVTCHTGKTLIERSNEVRGTLAEEVYESAKVLRMTPIEPTLDHLGERAAVTNRLADAAGEVFGWGETSKPAPLVNLNVLGSVELDELFAGGPACGVQDTASSVQSVPDQSGPSPGSIR